ncbi:MAG: glycosyltransferase, partial [Alphaproteobacteria bacterium]
LVFGYCPPELNVPTVPGAELRVLAQPKARGLFPSLCAYLRTTRPDVVFVAEDHLTIVLLLAAIATGSRARISGSSRVTPFDTYSGRPFTKGWILKQALRSVAWRADALTCVSHDMVHQYRSLFPRSKHRCVYNIVDRTASLVRMAEPVDDPWLRDGGPPVLVAAGSLAHYKGFDVLIEAFALVRAGGTNTRLVILGEGDDRGRLEEQIARHRLGDTVRLPGRVPNPLAWFARVPVFVLSSRLEGMPNVLVEAMACGCTVVAVDCPTGPRELLDDGRFGYLVPMEDPAALANGIVRALASPIDPATLDDALSPFAAERVIADHFEMLGLR